MNIYRAAITGARTIAGGNNWVKFYFSKGLGQGIWTTQSAVSTTWTTQNSVNTTWTTQ